MFYKNSKNNPIPKNNYFILLILIYSYLSFYFLDLTEITVHIIVSCVKQKHLENLLKLSYIKRATKNQT